MLRLDVLASGNLKSIAICMNYMYFLHFDFMHSEYMCYHDIFLLLTAVNCGTLNNPANGQVSHTGRTTYRQTATYSCDTGYNLVGDSTRTCQATRVWSGSEPTCQSVLLLKLEYYLLVLDMYTQNLKLCWSTGCTVFLDTQL